MKKGKKSFEFLINNLSDASLPVNSMPELDRLLSTFLNGSVIIFKIPIIIWFIFHQIFKGFKLGLFYPKILGNNSNNSTMKLTPSSCIEICKSCKLLYKFCHDYYNNLQIETTHCRSTGECRRNWNSNCHMHACLLNWFLWFKLRFVVFSNDHCHIKPFLWSFNLNKRSLK